MKTKISMAIVALGTIGTTAANAGGIDRTGQSLAPLFEQGNYMEFSLGRVSPKVSGTVSGASTDGNIAPDFRGQAEQAFRNVLTCLAASGFAATDLARLTIYITDRADIGDMRAARDAVLGADLCAPSTLLVISGLAAPEMKIEVEAIAARG